MKHSIESDILFFDTLIEVTSGRFSDYVIHVLCHQGTCSFKMVDKTFQVKEGDFIIWPAGHLISDIEVSDDFRVTVLYVSFRFARNHMPDSDYDIIGSLSLLENPILPLTDKEKEICRKDMEIIRWRLEDRSNYFYAELMGHLVIAFFLDLYNIHTRIYLEKNISQQNALLLRRFVSLLQTGEYKTNREVAHYAAKLYVTPKYLSEVCKRVSGRTPIFWIDRFTITEITRLLKDKDLTLTDIADRMNFSSISYFSRYVLRVLGVTPTEYRQGAE